MEPTLLGADATSIGIIDRGSIPMTVVTRAGQPCHRLTAGETAVDIPVEVGPRILGFSRGGPNVLAELPDTLIEAPGLEPYRCWGGHRLWVAPEIPEITYESEDHPVQLVESGREVEIHRVASSTHGVAKSMRISLRNGEVVVDHTVTNEGSEALRVAPWAITQFPLEGLAVMRIGATTGAGFQANRSLVLWPYTSLADPRLTVRDDLVAVRGSAGPPLKIGAAGHAGWLAYLRRGIVFVKRFESAAHGDYADLGATAQIFTGPEFLELETLGPLDTLSPGDAAHHQERWSLHDLDGGLSPAELAAFIEEETIR